MKKRILENIKENIEDQVADESWYFNWGGLDLECAIGLEERIARIIEIVRLYTTKPKRQHIVQEYRTASEIDTVDGSWMGHQIILHHPSVIDAAEDEVVQQIREAWPMINQIFLQEKNRCRLINKKKIDQLAIWKQFVAKHCSEFPDICSLLQIMVATPANTSPLERSYTKLQIVAAKRRNHFTPENLELMYLFAALDILLKEVSDYVAELQKLQ